MTTNLLSLPQKNEQIERFAYRHKQLNLLFGPKAQKIVAFRCHRAGGAGYLFPPYEAYIETHKKSSNQHMRGVKRPPKRTARTIGECYTARAALCHSDFDATEWYVESDLSLVEQVARQIG